LDDEKEAQDSPGTVKGIDWDDPDDFQQSRDC
jgi:hypothetical protein